jgi:hypothetical protein
MSSGFRINPAQRPRGFALVVTLSLMILLTLIAVGLLSLSSVALRTSSRGQAMSTARANARTALMLALGELQKQAGQDTRVTARADILPTVPDEYPPVLGVWRSWEGTDHETTGASAGRPISPGNYEQAKKDRFLGWLTSGDPNSLNNPAAPPNADPGTDKVTLVGNGSVGSGGDRDRLQIHLSPVQLGQNQEKGAYAWWIGGENQKARLPNLNKPANDNDIAEWAMFAKSHTTADPGVFRMDKLLDDATPAAKAISLLQSDLIADSGALPVSREFFHDLSATSSGLLTNTATGGWRKDLSLLTENWSRQPTGRASLPFFRVEPGKDINFSIPQIGGDHRPARSLLYPWASHGSSAGQFAIYQNGPACSWANLQEWATLYKNSKLTGTTASALSVNDFSVPSYRSDSNSCYDYLHKTRFVPILARVQWIFSHWAQARSVAGNTLYDPRLLMTPVITVWNPYNVSITLTQQPLFYVTREPLPNAFRYTVNGVANTKYAGLTRAPQSPNQPLYLLETGPLFSMSYRISNLGGRLRPGECRVFSPAATSRPPASAQTIDLVRGFRPGGGFYFDLKKDDGSVYSGLPASAEVKADAKFDTNTAEGSQNDQRVGIYLDMCYPTDGFDNVRVAYRMRIPVNMMNGIYGELTGLGSATVGQASGTPVPFMTTIFGSRTASNTHLPTKGFVQSSPLNCYSEFVNLHPANCAFDYSFKALAGAGDSWWPGSDSNGSGFIVTGFQSADGLKRCVVNELPVKPLQSLAELQHWDMRYDYPLAPFSFNIIGNSDATPLIPANNVIHSTDGGVSFRHDDSYCSNHLFFDDWFVSSIAPKSANFGRPPSSSTFQKTFTDFVSGTDPLPNRAYQPIAADAAVARTGNLSSLTTFIASRDSWRSVASRLEVEGMFNVNSTSVTAWRALLGHARNQKIPYQTPSGVSLSGQQDHAFSRFSIAGDTEAKTIGSSADFSDCAEFAGYRILDDKQLEQFAVEVVKQVRQRGPFLSLAEFVNRQLSSGDLALAGTVQAALNAIGKDNSLNPFAEIHKRSKPADYKLPLLPLPDQSGYQFPEAAVGHNTYGLPGWTRQADVLRPLAPILTARDDTFTIRAYGDARDATGKTVTARAVCEAVVRRTRDYVDPSDAADITALPKAAANLTFGRRFEIVSFRWLDANEI